VVFTSTLFLSTPLFAQSPAPPPPAPTWTGTASVGLALTSGNADTSTFNASYDFTFDPKRRNLVKADGLFLRGTSAGELTSDRLALDGRDEYKLHDRAFAFAQVQFLRDRFKDIGNLIAPSVGLGYRFADSTRTKISVDAGVGGLWEQDLSSVTEGSGLVSAGEYISQQLSASATVTQSLTALYRTDNFSDALYTFSTALATSITARTQVKVELLDTFKTLVVGPTRKNDTALIVGLVFKH
jgi:putative salt-induced outer membrane protein YdiY